MMILPCKSQNARFAPVRVRVAASVGALLLAAFASLLLACAIGSVSLSPGEMAAGLAEEVRRNASVRPSPSATKTSNAMRNGDIGGWCDEVGCGL